jgi:hypothetical protein
MSHDSTKDSAERPRFRPVPWTPLETPQDVELWIAEHDQAMQELVKPQETGVGVRFTLAPGGDIYLQTAGDAVLLDVEPDDKLIQLLLGLSTLVDSTLIVTGHNFGKQGRRVY